MCATPTGPPLTARTWVVGDADLHVRRALDHVLLGLTYLGDADVDGYLSLLSPEILVTLSSGRVLVGHDEVAAELGCAFRPLCANEIVAVGRSVVVATGTVCEAVGPATPVADLYVLDEYGLVRSCRRAATG